MDFCEKDDASELLESEVDRERRAGRSRSLLWLLRGREREEDREPSCHIESVPSEVPAS